MASPWINITPECIYWTVRNVCDLWKPKAIYITENGCSADDVVTPSGRIQDTDRVMYLRNHLTHLHRATSEGYPVKGTSYGASSITSSGATVTASASDSLCRLQNPEANSQAKRRVVSPGHRAKLRGMTFVS